MIYNIFPLKERAQIQYYIEPNSESKSLLSVTKDIIKKKNNIVNIF